MAWRRYFIPALVGALLFSSQLRAQGGNGTITGRVVDSASAQGIANVNVVIMGGQRGTLSRDDGGFTLANVPAGSYTVRASRIGYRPQTQPVSVTAGGTTTVTFTMTRQAAVLSEIVVTGYGTQRREAISGSVATFVHCPPHVIDPCAQTHAPETHASPLPHVLPHPPQLSGSVETFTHAPLHATVPLGHWHVPDTHVPPPHD